tara:strand:+ start:65 stop:397 length:333 start_codon:yes stop_codon:yes gene_type:complete
MTRRKRIYGKRRKRSSFKQKPKERQGSVYVGDKKFSDKPMYKGQQPSTHLMAYGESDGKFIAFPTLFQDDDGTWQQPDDAFGEAVKRKEIYQFDTEQEAKDFAGGSWKNK